MSRILLSPWNANWFATAFSSHSLQIARTRCRLPEHLFPDERLAVMGQAVLRGIYQPQPPGHIALAREGKAPRVLTIPQPPDRLLQAAFAQVLSMRLDPLLAPQSFAYRPKLSPQQALQAALVWIKQGLGWIVRADIRAFFDQISPAILHTTIGHFIDEWRARDLLQCWLQTVKPAHARGIAQGAPISPLLSNLYLDPLDRLRRTATGKRFYRGAGTSATGAIALYDCQFDPGAGRCASVVSSVRTLSG
jgi:CRISPR-associated protein Cas1